MFFKTCFSILSFLSTHPITRHKKGRAFLRFIKWQIASRLLPGPAIVDWINETRFIVGRNETGFTGNIYSGLHEFSDMGFLLHCLRPEDTFIDIGANIGSYTILASGAIGAHSISIEPIPKAYARLYDNILINHLQSRAKSFNFGLAEQPGVLRFTRTHDTMNRVILDSASNEDSITVPVSRLDDIAAGQNPTIIKVDVEGFETPVLKGGMDIIARESLLCIIMELNESGSQYGYHENDIIELMQQHGFEMKSYDPYSRTLTDLAAKNSEGNNTLFVRNIDEIRSRITSAPAFRCFDLQI